MTSYKEILAGFERKVLPLHQQHQDEVKRTYKQDAKRTATERMDHYMQNTYPRFQRQWHEARTEFVAKTATLMRTLERTVYGTPDSSHIIGLASVADEKLEEVLSVAKAAGDQKLEESVIAVARQREQRALVNKWIVDDPARTAAQAELRQMPELDRLEPITLGYRPPKASPEALEPDHAAIERQQRAQRSAEAERRSFLGESAQTTRWGPPKPVVGSWVGHDR